MWHLVQAHLASIASTLNPEASVQTLDMTLESHGATSENVEAMSPRIPCQRLELGDVKATG